METVVHPESGLSKARWTDWDIDALSWQSCQIHAIAVIDDEGPPDDLSPEEFAEQDDLDDTAPSGLSLLFDLDYIVRRVDPSGPGKSYKFWVAPATLIFGAVVGITGDLRGLGMPFEMKNLHRLGPVIPHDQTKWHLEGRDFDLKFTAWDFGLHLRQPPRLGHRVLRRAERGGLSFAISTFA